MFAVKIFLKILKNEVGLGGLIFLLIADVFIGLGKTPEDFYTTNFLPLILFTGFLFDFKKNNKLFIHQFSYYSKSELIIKMFSVLWSVSYCLYTIILYTLAHRQLPLDILIAVYFIFITCYMVSCIILLRSLYLNLSLIIFFILIFWLDWSISLPVSVIIFIYTFYPFKTNKMVFSKKISFPHVGNAFRSNKFIPYYKINQSNYFVKYLMLSVQRHHIHKVVMKSLIYLLPMSLFFIILILRQHNGLPVIHFLIFIIPVILTIILTYCLILCRPLFNQPQFRENASDLYFQFTKIYMWVFYILIMVILISGILISRIGLANPDFILLLLSVTFYMHTSHRLLFYSQKYVLNVTFVFLIGLTASILPEFYQLIYSTVMYLIMLFVINLKKVKLQNA